MIFLAWLFTLIFTMIVGGLYGGTIFQDLWLWFVVPLGMEPLSLAHAMGLSTTIGFFAAGILIAIQKNSVDSDPEQALAKVWGTWIAGIILNTLVWGWAAIIHSFM